MILLATGIMYLASLGIFGCDRFVDTVLENFTRHSIFVSVPVAIEGRKETAVIENRSLFEFFKIHGSYDRVSYKVKVCSILSNGERVDISSSDQKKFGFNVMSISQKLQEDANSGRADYLKKYLKNGSNRSDLNSDEKYAVIHQLFKWKIASAVDDESGLLVTFDPADE